MTGHQALADGFREFYLRSQRLLDARMRAQGASFARTRLLCFIENSGSVRATDIGEAFGYAPRTVTVAIDGLEREGLVRRDPDPNDRRVKHISVTAAGQAITRNVEPIRLKFLEQSLGMLDSEEVATLMALIGKVNVRLEAMARSSGLASADPIVKKSGQQDVDQP